MNPKRRPVDRQIARQLRQAMNRAGVGVCELARQLGVAHQTLSIWLAGHKVPSIARLRQMARVLRATFTIPTSGSETKSAQPDAGRAGADPPASVLPPPESTP